MKIKRLALLFLFVSVVDGFSQKFRFSEFSFANNGGTGTPNDPIAGGTYNGSPDWVELYNTSTTSTYTLSGWYLSDDRYNLRKWQIPTAIIGGSPITVGPLGTAVIYLCEHDKAVTPALGPNGGGIDIDLHANFSCHQTKPGSKVYLTENNLQLRDSIDIYRYKNKPGHSWGRAFDLNATPKNVKLPWRLYQIPSPGGPNPDTLLPLTSPPAWYINYCPTPKLKTAPGYYSAVQSLNVDIEDTTNFNTYIDYDKVEIWNTIDCSVPTSSGQTIPPSTQGTALQGQITINSPNPNCAAAIVRSMMIETTVPKRYLDGFEAYGAYIEDTIRQNHKISITCVCVDTTKLFTAQSNDSVPMIIHHFDKNDKEAFKNVGQGHRSKIDFYNTPGGPPPAFKQWQWVFRSEDEYGYRWTNTSQLYKDATLGYSDRTDFPEIMFRSAAEENFLYPGLVSSANGFLPSHIRDFFNHTMGLRHKLRFDQSHYAPTYVIMNGLVRGIYYMKETIDSLYTTEYYDRPRAAILTNSLAGSQAIVSGLAVPTAQTHWNWFYSWAMNPTTNVHMPALYYRISDSLDFNSLNDYMIYNFLSVNTDFIKRYGSWWKGLPTDTSDHRPAKWRFALTNTDFTWGYDVLNSAGVSNTTPTNDPCNFLDSYSLFWPSQGNNTGNNQYPIVPLWYKLMANDTFKSEFITRYSDLLNTALTCDSLTDHLKYVRSLLTTQDMEGHVWTHLGDFSGTCVGCDSVSYWNDQMDSIKVFIMQRCSLVNSGLVNCFPEISGPYNLCIDVEPVNSGYVQLNSLELKSFVWNGKYFDSIINVIKAIAYQNYVFDHWETKFTMSPNINSDSATFYLPADGCIKAVFKLRPAYETTGEPMLPTGFSPNADGNNDILNVYGIAEASSYEMEVFNRWGERVFRSEDKTKGWDGRFNGTDVPAGVYAYRYNIIMNGKTYANKGSVTLVR